MQIGHRKSVDIDLFANKKQNNGIILDSLKDHFKYYDMLNITNNGLQLMIKNIKVDIMGMNQNILEDINSEDNMHYYGKQDISAMKLRAVLYRDKFRDYVDIAYLLKAKSKILRLSFTNFISVIKTMLFQRISLYDLLSGTSPPPKPKKLHECQPEFAW